MYMFWNKLKLNAIYRKSPRQTRSFTSVAKRSFNFKVAATGEFPQRRVKLNQIRQHSDTERTGPEGAEENSQGRSPWKRSVQISTSPERAAGSSIIMAALQAALAGSTKPGVALSLRLRLTPGYYLSALRALPTNVRMSLVLI